MRDTDLSPPARVGPGQQSRPQSELGGSGAISLVTSRMPSFLSKLWLSTDRVLGTKHRGEEKMNKTIPGLLLLEGCY